MKAPPVRRASFKHLTNASKSLLTTLDRPMKHGLSDSKVVRGLPGWDYGAGAKASGSIHREKYVTIHTQEGTVVGEFLVGATSLKEIIIRLGTGTIQTGFNNIIVELKSSQATQWEDRSNLPANPDLQQLLNQWQLLYPAAIQILSPDVNLSSAFEANTVTNVSTQDIVELNYNFRIALNNWFNFSDFARIDRRLRTELNVLDRVLVVIISEQLQVWQLPWHFWEFFNDYTQAIEVFAKPRFADVRQIDRHRKNKVNILTLSGRDPRLTLTLPFLKTLPQAHSQPLETTSAYEIANQLNQSQPWDILIFNGHGDTVRYQYFGDGVIYLDNDTPLEISRLKTEIQTAVDRGLQIAIFNCCNGLGLAEQLSDLNIPYIIVMREIVPNQCAQDFLQQLLTRYSQGDSFPAAFRQARQSLCLSPGGFTQFADWLPILFHNPLSHHVTWRDLSAPKFRNLIPDRLSKICNYLGQPNHQISTSIILGLCGSLLAFNTQSQPQIVAWENIIIDRIQAIPVEMMPKSPSKVTIVNYDALDLLGHVSSDLEIQQLIDLVEQETKPAAWGINFVMNNSTIFDRSNVIRCRKDKVSRDPAADRYLHLSRCDRQLINTLPGKFNLDDLTDRDFRLNFSLLNQIEHININDIANLSTVEIERKFNHKIILVGNFDGREINLLAKKAMAIDRVIRLHDPQYPLPLFVNRSVGEQFLWIFGWSILAGVLAWRSKWQLLLIVGILGEILIAGVLLALSQGVPILVPPISMIAVGGVVRILKIARSERNIRYLPNSID
jgi:hypothetical protein